MVNRSATISIALLLVLIAVVATSAGGQRRPGASEPSPVTVRLPGQPAAQGCAGEEACRSCHRAELTEFHKSPHARVAAAAGAQHMDCESCHGPGKAHADAQEAAHGDDAASAAANKLIFAFKGTPAENSARCLTCHAAATKLQRVDHSQHGATVVSWQ